MFEHKKMFSNLLILIILNLLRRDCVARLKDSPSMINGFVSGDDQNHIYYGALDLDTSSFDVWSTFSLIEIGNPNHLKYSVLPLTYDSYNDLIYIATLNDKNETKLSVIAGTNGALISTFTQIKQTIISLEFDIFQKKLFAHLQINEYQSSIVEIDTFNGTIKHCIGILNNFISTALSTYSPVTKQYFLIMIHSDQYLFIAFNTTNSTESMNTSIDFIPLNMRYDYKTSTIYMTYLNQPDHFISSIGILDQQTGHIDQHLAILTYNSNIHLMGVSTYDTAKDIYYTSIFSNEYNSTGMICIDTDREEIQSILLPKNITKTHGWFIKQLGY